MDDNPGYRTFACTAAAPDAISQKPTRPDGEIRAGRVDRRRGSGG
jgi:hypothetical protein